MGASRPRSKHSPPPDRSDCPRQALACDFVHCVAKQNIQKQQAFRAFVCGSSLPHVASEAAAQASNRLDQWAGRLHVILV